MIDPKFGGVDQDHSSLQSSNNLSFSHLSLQHSTSTYVQPKGRHNSASFYIGELNLLMHEVRIITVSKGDPTDDPRG
jgi:hypothetical protein